MMRKWLEERLWEWKWKREGKRFASYPPCDHLNIALNFLLSNPTENVLAIEEICYAIIKANGYYHRNVEEALVMYGFGRFVLEEMVHE